MPCSALSDGIFCATAGRFSCCCLTFHRWSDQQTSVAVLRFSRTVMYQTLRPAPPVRPPAIASPGTIWVAAAMAADASSSGPAGWLVGLVVSVGLMASVGDAMASVEMR